MPKLLPPSPAGSALSAGLRRYLYLTALVCGAMVLVVEILGAKMLSPFFGTSHFVWTAQIAVTLVSLACGYWFGGVLVDRSQRLHRLYLCVAIAAGYLCLTIPLCRPVAIACLKLELAMGSLLASIFLFFVPLALLAAVGPFLVRVMTASMTDVGRQVGRLSAISTFGSVAGTISIGYVLIPFLPNSVTMAVTACILFALAGIYAVYFGRRSTPAALGAIAALGLGAAALASQVQLQAPPPNLTELEQRSSNFGLMQVLDETPGGGRYYLNDYLVQNAYDPVEKRSLTLFTYMLHELTRAYTPKVEDALCIGMGIGVVPMQLAKEGVRVDVVEINPAVVPLAQRYFDFKPEQVRLVIDDGRHFLYTREKRYDTILLDAFLGDSSPSHLMTREAFTAMHDALQPGGTLVINSFGSVEHGKDFSTASLEKTLRRVFKGVKIHAAESSGNIFIVASDREPLEFLRPTSAESAHPTLRIAMQAALVSDLRIDPKRGRVLTDDFNPIEFFDAPNREESRQALARYMARPKS